MSKLRVGVIYGGRSGEHEVSIASAAAVFQNLDRDRYEPIPIRVEKDGRWTLPSHPPTLISAAAVIQASSAAVVRVSQEVEDRVRVPAGRAGDPTPRAGGGEPDRTRATEAPTAGAVTETAELEAHLLPRPGADTILTMDRGRASHPGQAAVSGLALDVVFPVLHGPYGEDGTIQGLLELANVAYVGAGVLASAVGMDKAVMKLVFSARGLPIVDYDVFLVRDWRRNGRALLSRLVDRLGFPMFVKPVNLGSSVGISKARHAAELKAAIEVAAEFDRKIIVEAAVPHAREIECAVLGNDDPDASVPGEIIPSREFYDYQAKYLDDDSKLLIPAPLTEALTAEVRALAVAAFKAVDAAGMARVDFLLAGDSGVLYLNELNTIPGFTTISMYAKLWSASGLEYPALLDRLIALALERHGEKQRIRTSI